MDLFNSLPLKKQEYMNRLFRNCTEEVKYYMSVIDVEADQTFIKAGEEYPNDHSACLPMERLI